MSHAPVEAHNEPPSPLARDVRQPHDARDNGSDRSKLLLKVALEVVFVSLGVFLALMADQWRQSAHTRELAQASLRGFRSEIRANRDKVVAVNDYHDTLLASLRRYLGRAVGPESGQRQNPGPAAGVLRTDSMGPCPRDAVPCTHRHAGGIQPVSHLRSSAHLYGPDTRHSAGRVPAPTRRELRRPGGVLRRRGAVEPALVRMYDEVLPQIQRALGESAVATPTRK